MSSYVAGALIAAASAALGYGASVLRDRAVRREAARAANRAELYRAMREYGAALDAAILEAADLPINPRMNALDRWFERQVRATVVEFVGHIVVRLLKRAVYGHRHEDISDRLVAAANRLRLVAPPQVEECMLEADKLVKEHRSGDDEWTERWGEYRSRLRQVCRDALDSTRALNAESS
jgi:hypothetical protein